MIRAQFDLESGQVRQLRPRLLALHIIQGRRMFSALPLSRHSVFASTSSLFARRERVALSGLNAGLSGNSISIARRRLRACCCFCSLPVGILQAL